MWLELAETWFNTDAITAVRAAALGKSKTHSIIYCIGHSPVDGGFLVAVPIHSVVEQLRDARFMEIVERLDDEQEAEEQIEEAAEPPEAEVEKVEPPETGSPLRY